MSDSHKVTFSLPAAVVDRLSVVSYQLGVSRSALVSVLLYQALGDMERAIDKGVSLAGGSGNQAVTGRRLRGRLVDDLREFVALARMVDGGQAGEHSESAGAAHAE